jgi:ADP-ribose pyrophosphatase YjhB (NUDIX family)
VTRGDTLLVFAHRGDPRPGIQVPAGHVDDGESIVDAAVREVSEETGVACEVERVLGVLDQPQLDGEVRRNHFVLATTSETRDLWSHVGTGGGLDDGLTFDCGFVSLDHAPFILCARQSAFVECAERHVRMALSARER